jgi:N-acetyl-gamma-glutamylphosphate reductase
MSEATLEIVASHPVGPPAGHAPLPAAARAREGAATSPRIGVPVPATVPTVILGASGYVGGELLRLLAFHPVLRLAGAVSGSHAGAPIASVFPHLLAAYPSTRFVEGGRPGDLLDLGGALGPTSGAAGSLPTAAAGAASPAPLAVFSALPHGHAATALDALLSAAEARGRELLVVDLAADFRLADPDLYARIYGRPHPAPGRLASFYCGLPDLCRARPQGPVAHPGCFTTAVTLAAAPLVALGLVTPELVASAVTGSTGSGREPAAATHHPERHGDLRAYNPLGHRHRPEMELLLGRAGRAWGEGRVRPGTAPAGTGGAEERWAGVAPSVAFVPHSGPFARGIHATVVGHLREPLAAEELAARLAAFYADSPFVSVSTAPPRLKEVVGTNRCHLGVATHGHEVVVLSVLDNLVKGAAGGGVQWMNRLLGLPDDTGLALPGLGWS